MSADGQLPAAYRLVTFDVIDSTNEEAKRLAAAGAAEGTVVWAGRQTAGKGRRGRCWTSEPGNLFCSLVLRPDDPPAAAMQIGFVAANGLADAISGMISRGAEVQCKWPNDILVDGRKTAGVLLESTAGAKNRLDWLIVGIGVNVDSFPDQVAFPATSLAAEGGDGADARAVLVSFLHRFSTWLATWRSLGFAPVRAAWLRRARGVGAPLTVRLERETLEGTFVGLDGDGALLLQGPRGRRRVTAGDVFFAAA